MSMGLVLENEFVRIVFDRKYGRLNSLYSKRQKLEFIREKRLSENFRVLVPKKDVVDNYVIGREQRLSSFKLEKNKLELHWKNLVSRTGKLDIDLTMEVGFGTEDEDISFRVMMDNRTDLYIEELSFPVFGGVNGLRNRSKTKVLQPIENILWGGHPMYNVFQKIPFFPYWAINEPFVHSYYPSYLFSNFVDVNNGKEGLYIGNHGKPYELSGFHIKFLPCMTASGKWPSPPAVSKDTPVGAILFPTKFIFRKKGKYVSEPVVVRFHSGYFEKASERHRRWLNESMGFCKTPEWFKNIDSWLTISMCSGSDKVYYKYKDIPKIAREAFKYGVKSLHIQGHDLGGQDRCYPRFDKTDPRMGTEKELIKAIKEVHKIGMKVIIFMKINRAHITNDKWFKKELHKYAIKDKYGEPLKVGWGYGTTLEVTGHDTSYMARMCPYPKRWQDIMIEKSRYVIEKWGADGINYDEICDNFRVCYDKSHGHNPGAGVNEGMLEILRRIKIELQRIKPDVVMGGEAVSDLYFQHLDFSYSRHWLWDVNYTPPMAKYLLPEKVSTLCIDYCQQDGINYALMNGHLFALEPKCMHGTMVDFKEMLPYIREIIKIRKEYFDFLWNGKFVYHNGVRVIGDLHYGAFENETNPDCLAVVIVNNSDEVKNGFIKTDEDFSNALIRVPFKSEKTLKKPFKIFVAPLQAIVVILKK